MAKTQFKIVGDKEVDKFFTRLPYHLQDKVLRSAYVLASQPYRKALKANTDSRTGQLKNSVGIRSVRKGKGQFIKPIWVGYIAKRGGWYSHFVEGGRKGFEATNLTFKNSSGDFVSPITVAPVAPKKTQQRTWSQTKSQVEMDFSKTLSTAIYRFAKRTIKKYA